MARCSSFWKSPFDDSACCGEGNFGFSAMGGGGPWMRVTESKKNLELTLGDESSPPVESRVVSARFGGGGGGGFFAVGAGMP